jgi:hypothetical protein
MTSVVFYIENYRITYSVDWLGVENIMVNDSIVSKKLSLPKRKHRFSLTINEENVSFYITSKQSFSASTVEVFLYRNDLIFKQQTVELYQQQKSPTNDQGSTYILGLIFVVLSLCFDWHKLFLFIGLVLLFYAFNIKPNISSEANLKVEKHHNSTNL